MGPKKESESGSDSELPDKPPPPEPPDKSQSKPPEESSTSNAVILSRNDLLPPIDMQENVLLVTSKDEIPIHLQYAKFPKPTWPKSPVTIPSSFFRDLTHRVKLNSFQLHNQYLKSCLKLSVCSAQY